MARLTALQTPRDRPRQRTVVPAVDLIDSTTTNINSKSLLVPRGVQTRDENGLAARLSQQFVAINQKAFTQGGVRATVDFDGASVSLRLQASSTIGALPLISPTTGRPAWTMNIRPRFEWIGIGSMLTQMGWRVIPQIAPFPVLPRSDRHIPRWVPATIVLFRMRELLKQSSRRFEITSAMRTAPKGAVQWRRYATDSMARGRFLDVPCQYPELQSDRDLRAASRFTLELQIAALESQRVHGAVVMGLLAIAGELLQEVRDVAPREPSPVFLDRWLRRTLSNPAFGAGIEAIEWTANERGLAGVSNLSGLPWVMPMDAFFEAWGETVLTQLATLTGAVLRTGRNRQTLAPINWDPAYVGSQRYLLPDLILERADVCLVVDTKYKPHLEELEAHGWTETRDEIRESHRNDFLQALAYGNLSSKPRTIVCLAYPCSVDTWRSMRQRSRVIHRGSVTAGERDLDVVLTAFPMGVPARAIAEEMLPIFAGSS